MYKYQPKDNEEHYRGVPARDLSDSEVEALTDEQQYNVLEGSLYVHEDDSESVHTKPAKRATMSATDAAPASASVAQTRREDASANARATDASATRAEGVS